jgi:hypothetical protein
MGMQEKMMGMGMEMMKGGKTDEGMKLMEECLLMMKQSRMGMMEGSDMMEKPGEPSPEEKK